MAETIILLSYNPYNKRVKAKSRFYLGPRRRVQTNPFILFECSYCVPVNMQWIEYVGTLFKSKCNFNKFVFPLSFMPWWFPVGIFNCFLLIILCFSITHNECNLFLYISVQTLFIRSICPVTKYMHLVHLYAVKLLNGLNYKKTQKNILHYRIGFEIYLFSYYGNIASSSIAQAHSNSSDIDFFEHYKTISC